MENSTCSSTRTRWGGVILAFTFALMLALGVCTSSIQQAYADDEITVNIGTGTSTNATVPLALNYNNSASAAVYPASAIVDDSGDAIASGTITRIAYTYGTKTSRSYTGMQVWMGYTSEAQMASGLQPTNAVLVYSDDGGTIANADDTQLVINLTTPFEFDAANGNLMVVVNLQGSEWKSSQFICSSGVSYHYKNDNTALSSTDLSAVVSACTTSTSYIPNIQLSIIAGAPAPKVTAQPEGYVYLAGSDTTALTATATTATDALSAQWYKAASAELTADTIAANATAVGDAQAPTLADGAGTTTYTPTAAELGTEATNVYYYCLFEDANGKRLTAPATIQVYTEVATAPTGPVVITSDPAAVSGKVKVYEGTTVSLTATGAQAAAEGDVLYYQWYKKAADDEDFSAIDGAAEATYAATATDGVVSYKVAVWASHQIPSNTSDAIESDVLIVQGLPLTTVTVGTGTSSGYNAPYYTYYEGAMSEMIYTASELGDQGGTIRSLSFQVATNGQSFATSHVEVYLAHTSKTAFDSGTDFIPAADFTQVYSGAPTLGSKGSGWETIVLDTPFDYNGTDNLAVAIVRSSSSYNNNLKYYYTSTTDSTVIYKQKDGQAAAFADLATAISSSNNGDGKTEKNRPNIQVAIASVAGPKVTASPEGFTYKSGDAQTTALTATATSSQDAVTAMWYKAASGDLTDTETIADLATAVTEPAAATEASGAFSSTYTPAASELTEPGTVYYYCLFADEDGAALSAPAAIQVYTEDAEAPTGTLAITVDPEATNDELEVNETTPLTFTATGITAAAEGDTLYYQWYKKSATDADFVAIEGATEATYATPAVAGVTAYKVEAWASHQIGSNLSEKITSNNTITVTGTALTIMNAEQLADFRNVVNNGDSFEGRTALLGADIDLSSIENWVAIGTSANRFKGTFDGQGFAITGMKIETASGYQGLFGYVQNATLKNFTISGTASTTADSVNYLAGVAAYGQAPVTIENVGSEVAITISGNYAAGILAYCNGNNAENPITITNCFNKASLTGTGSYSSYLAGIVGRGNTEYCILTSCYNTGVITAYNNSGGLIGNSGRAKNCYNSGMVNATGSYTGSIAGRLLYADAADPDYALAGTHSNLAGSGADDAEAVISVTAEQLAGTEAFEGATLLDELNYTHADTWIAGSELDPAQESPALSWEAVSVDPADQEAVEAVAAAFTGYAFPVRYTKGYTNVADAVKDVMKEYDAWQDGMTVSFKSSDETESIDADGTIHYKESAFGYVNVDNVSNCVFTVKLKGAEADTSARTVQIGWNLDYYKAQMQAEADAFVATSILGDNESLDAVVSDLELDGSGGENVGSSWSVITWTSSNTDVIAIQDKDYTNDYIGAVTRPTGDDEVVTLTATFVANDTKLTSNCENQEEIGAITKEIVVTVTGLHKPPVTPEFLLDLLDTYYIPAIADYDDATKTIGSGNLDLAAGIDNDLQMPRYTRIKDENNELVFNNGEISLASSNSAVLNIASVYRVNVINATLQEDVDATLTITITRDGITASKDLPVRVLANITEEMLEAEAAKLQLVIEHYWDGINDSVYANMDEVTGSLHPFQEANVDDEGNVTFVYNANEKTNTGFNPDSYFEDPWEMESAGYNLFKSSAPTILQHENLVMPEGAQPEDSTQVAISSLISSEKYGDAAAANPDNEKLQALYKQEVSCTVTVLGTKIMAARAAVEALPEAAAVTEANREDIEAAREAYNALTADDKARFGDELLAKLEADEAALGIGEEPVITETTLSNARINAEYEASIVATGVPYPTFALADGATMPAGLTLTANGAISGTPTTEGTYTFDVVATNASGSATFTMTLAVVPKYESPEGTVLLSISKDGSFIRSDGDLNSGALMANVPVDLAELAKIDLDDYGLGEYKADENGDASFDITELHLLIYASKNFTSEGIEGLQVSGAPRHMKVNKIFSGDDNVVFWVNGLLPFDFTINEGATADVVALSDGKRVDIAMFSDRDFYESPDSGMLFFVPEEGRAYPVDEYTATVGETFTVKLDLAHPSDDMSVTYSAMNGYTIGYGTTPFDASANTVTTDVWGKAEIVLSEAGTWYVWAAGVVESSDDMTGSEMTAQAEMAVSSPALAKVTVTDAAAPVDKTALDAAITDAKKIEQGKKTDEAYKALQDAIAAAQKVSGDEDATQAQVNAAKKALEDAVKAFEASDDQPDTPEPPAVDKSALEKLVKEVGVAETANVWLSEDGSDVPTSEKWRTRASVEAFDEALAAANKVLADEKATQAQVDAAYAALEKAAKDHAPKPGTKDEPDYPIHVDELWTRLFGDNAFETMSEIISAGSFEKGGTVVLASLEGYWDALTAAGVAGLEGAPVVMTLPDGLSDQAVAQLKALAPAKIVVCGGTYWIPDEVVAQAVTVSGSTPAVKRLAGAVAVNTAEEIAAYGKGRWSDTAIVATVGTFQDALAAAPLSYAKQMPIYLAQFDFATETGSLAQSTIDSMKANGITKAYIAGGTYWLPQSITEQLEKAGITVVKQLMGETAVETSAAIAAEAAAELGMRADDCGLADARAHYDALASAAFCGKNNSVLLLVHPDNSSSLGFVSANHDEIAHGYVFGGESSVSSTVMRAAQDAGL